MKTDRQSSKQQNQNSITLKMLKVKVVAFFTRYCSLAWLVNGSSTYNVCVVNDIRYEVGYNWVCDLIGRVTKGQTSIDLYPIFRLTLFWS